MSNHTYIIEKALNHNILLTINGLKELKALHSARNHSKRIALSKVALSMRITNQTRNHIHNLEQPANPHMLLGKLHQHALQLLLLLDFKID
jgi:hypothetical protein